MLRWQIDTDRIASSDFDGSQNDPQDTGLADEIALLVAT
jgi:hypothetical protein